MASDAGDNLIEGPWEKPQEAEAEVKDLAEMSGENAMKVLEDAVNKHEKAANDNVEWPVLRLAGEKIANPKEALQNFWRALNEIRKFPKAKFDFKLNEMFFKQMAGNKVGEATEKGIVIDPVMLMHPAARLAQVIAHEVTHNKKLIMNEALVEAYVERFFGKTGLEHVYDKAVEQFEEFARRFDKGGDGKRGTEDIYNLFYNGRFGEIYDTYKKNYVDGLKTDGEQDKALDFFSEVFPELHYNEDERSVDDPSIEPNIGYQKLKRVKMPEPEPTDLNDYKKAREEKDARRMPARGNDRLSA